MIYISNIIWKAEYKVKTYYSLCRMTLASGFNYARSDYYGWLRFWKPRKANRFLLSEVEQQLVIKNGICIGKPTRQFNKSIRSSGECYWLFDCSRGIVNSTRKAYKIATNQSERNFRKLCPGINRSKWHAIT